MRFGWQVLISIDFDDFICVYTLVLGSIERYIKHSRRCFISYPNTSNFVKNTPLCVVFTLTLFSVFGILMKHGLSCLMYYLIFSVFVRLHLLIVVLLYFHAGYWIAMMRYMNELRVRMNWQEGQSSKI